MKSLQFDAYRLGLIRSNMEEVEPLVRNADMVSIDISSIRQSDAPACGNPTPGCTSGKDEIQI